MSKEERIEIKLGMIYESLLDINWRLDKLENKQRKEDAKRKKEDAELILQDIEYSEGDYWNKREARMREFYINNSCEESESEE